MPFKKVKDKIEWVSPNKNDIDNFNSSLIKTSGPVALTHELKTRVDDALKSLSPQGSVTYFTNNNISTYNLLKTIVKTPPGLVDVILPVYNSFHLVKKCIDLVLKRTYWPFHLYIVDDSSDSYTAQKLIEIQQKNSDKISLIRNIKNKGFAASVNRGIKKGNGEYVCLLNSDVFVTDLWLTKMIMALKADPRNQLVCPTTNNTAIIEVPLSSGASYLQTNRIFESFTTRRYPEIMPTGFCLLFERDLLEKIGYFDESYVSYGEDSDFWYRTIRYAEGANYKRYRAVLADDTFVFHQRSGSFSSLGTDSHTQLRKLASGRFNRLWPEWVEWRKNYDVNKALGVLKDKIHPALLKNQDEKYRICWVVHSAELCGGMSYITDIVNALIEKGINAKVAVIKANPDGKESFMSELTTAPVFFNSYEEFLKNFRTRVFTNGFVVASTVSILPAVNSLCDLNSNFKPVLHTQSYEIDMVKYLKVDANQNIQRYINLFKGAKNIISSSSWITKKLENDLNVHPFATILPGINTDLFYPRDRSKGDERKTVLIPMVQGKDGFETIKGYNRGLLLIHELERLSEARGLDLRILVFAADSLPTITSAVCLGALTQTRLASILGTEIDAFIDPSAIHSYGLPALEALASGVKVFSWDNRGIREYGDNIVDIFNENESPTVVANSIINYLSDDTVINHYRLSFSTIRAHIEARHNRNASIDRFILELEKHLNVDFTPRNITVIAPHLRKHGGPTTMLAIANELKNLGHNVQVSTYYNDKINDEVISMTNLPISLDPSNLSGTDLVITNSDNPLTEWIASKTDIKKIMLKLSHNARFKAEEEKGLNQKWDGVVVTSDWLKDACENVTPGWTYPTCKATKIGWWNYSFDRFNMHPDNRKYGNGIDSPFIISTLVHAHPSKGTQTAISILGQVYLKYRNKVRFIGVGEIPSFSCDLPNFQYIQSPTREQMANIMKQSDIWLGASQTEGLGRMGLEAMSAGCAVVLSNTGAEYVEHEANSLVYEIGDVAAAIRYIETLLDNPGLAQELRQSGYKTASYAADPTECINELQRVILNVFA